MRFKLEIECDNDEFAGSANAQPRALASAEAPAMRWSPLVRQPSLSEFLCSLRSVNTQPQKGDMMERTKVESGNINSIGYAGGTLEVEFKGGGTYRYSGVPAEVHQELVGADSVGSAFARLIKRGGYDFEKVED